jgi:hypothetical protein
MVCTCVYSVLNLKTNEVLRFSNDRTRRLTALWTDNLALVQRVLGVLDEAWRPCTHTADPTMMLLLLRFHPVDLPSGALAA